MSVLPTLIAALEAVRAVRSTLTLLVGRIDAAQVPVHDHIQFGLWLWLIAVSYLRSWAAVAHCDGARDSARTRQCAERARRSDGARALYTVLLHVHTDALLPVCTMYMRTLS